MKEFFKSIFSSIGGVFKTAIICGSVILGTIIVMLGILIGMLIM